MNMPTYEYKCKKCGNVFVIEGDPLTVCRDPLTVLRAAENGDTQVIAIFTDYTPDALRRIASVMDANKIEVADLF